jgi:hypothetical protein
MPISLFEIQNGTSIAGDVSGLTETLDSLRIQLGSKFSQIQIKQGQIVSVQGQISNFQFIINQGPGTFPNINPQYASALAAIGPAQTQLAGYQGELSTLTTERDVIIGDIDALELKIANTRASISVDTNNTSLELVAGAAGAPFSSTWRFNASGELVYPNSALQRDTGTVSCPGNASTVVYTAAGQYQHTIRLLIQVEGSVPGQPYDTQACEMIIAKSFRADDIAATVYGIVHTSVAPLATFTALWNGLTNRVEVLCATTAIAVSVRIFATEITTSD